MCRQSLLWGCCMLALGFGILLGTWLKSGLVCHLFGFGFVLIGVCALRKC